MQTRSGGLAYWPGGREPNLWGTCYASTFLIEAKAAGHSIDIEAEAQLRIDELIGHDINVRLPVQGKVKRR